MVAAVGVDYSTHYIHLALVDERGRVRHRINYKVLDHLDPTWINGLRAILRGLAEELPERVIYVEKPWVRGGHFVHTAMALARAAAIIETVAGMEAIDIKYVLAASWRKVVYGKAGQKSKEAKELALAFVKEHYEVETKDHNEAEAILIARYGSQQSLR